MSRWSVPAQTQDLQRRAADPMQSAWVSAHAGSGKTHVLSRRVVRLLLAGAPPSKILCLTFTKAAAANMSLRVFSILSAWTRMDDAELAASIMEMGGDPARLDLARRLFARTVETPGGLKIQTIHAFCERLLHLFPFEANVAARFEVLTEDKQAELVAAARETTLATAMDDEESPAGQALRMVAAETTSFTFDGLLAQALHMRGAIGDACRREAGAYARALRRRLGLADDASLASIEREICEGGVSPDAWPGLAERIDTGSTNDKKAAQRVRDAIAAQGSARVDAWRAVFFTDKGPRARVVTKSVSDQFPGLLDMLERECARLEPLLELRKAAATVERSEALVTLADEILRGYTQLKRARGLLDFEDLVERTRTLLRRSSAQWVLYKLDAGIDHILVDEAQDTSPDQWDILEDITGEFFAGESARQTPRTFFAVGDEKQSIFSFQGAAPDAFAQKQKAFARRAADGGRELEAVRLKLSFRSSPVVLGEVDRVFEANDHHKGVVGEGDVWTPHEAWKADLPGLVELWEPIAASGHETPRDWLTPLDRLEETDPPVALARRIAATVAGFIAPGSREAVHEKDGSPRAVRAGDILILVRKRGPFFEAVIRALKDRGVPVAGADRLQLTEHIAVMDLVAAGRAALLPDDDLTLACVLKSPLLELDDDDLLAIAPQRKGSLFAALRASPDAKHQKAARRIEAWRARAGDSPFRFYAHILGAEGGRRAFLARLGAEAGDAVDEFLKLALESETVETPSLVTFLHRMSSAELSIKRDMEAAGDAVRVMTVHAAKGLESRIVFLPDTCGAAAGGHDPNLVKLEGVDGRDLVVWRKGAKVDPQPVCDALAAERRKEENEHRRLLYVAMTRAEERLYVCGYHGVRGPQAGCWWGMIKSALDDALAQGGAKAPAPWDATDMVTRRGEPAQLPAPAQARGAAAPPEGLPPWLTQPALREQAPAPPISPSRALAAADQADPGVADAQGTGAAAALRLGALTHKLLQHLPDVAPESRRDAALRFLAVRARDLDEARRVSLADRALAVIAEPSLAPAFGPGSRAEVAIAAKLPLGGRDIPVAGQIDRICIGDREVAIVDFKSGAPRDLDALPQAYVAQLALYRAAAALLWPGRTIRAVLVWTAGPRALDVPQAMLDDALARLAR